MLMRSLHEYVRDNSLHPFQGYEGGVDSRANSDKWHDDARDDDMFVPLVVEDGTSLVGIEREAEVSPADFLDPRQSGNKDIRYDYGFRERNPVAVNHFCGPPDGYLSLQEVVNDGNSAPANHNNCDADSAFAELQGSITASGQNTPQICRELSSGFGRKYHPANDAALGFYIDHCNYSDIPVDRLNRSVSGEHVLRYQWLGYRARVVSFSHEAAHG